MKSFPKDVFFRFSWRPYQTRVLSELEDHMEDRRLHVVAAPASGKTILGLEVARRINGPTLVLAPTLAIRDQWIQRLTEFFLPQGSPTPDWISWDLNNPGFFTVSTYQMLHSTMKQEDEQIDADNDEDNSDDSYLNDPTSFSSRTYEASSSQTFVSSDLIALLNQSEIKTVILDEAHHLRTNWWRSLISCINGLKEPRILALTATPPYDVSAAEWDRYHSLCGPVDAEISVPELVLDENLCPHQDLVVFSTPSEVEGSTITSFRDAVRRFVKSLQENASFTERIQSHPWLSHTESYIDEILEAPDFFSSMIVYLVHSGVGIPSAALQIIAETWDDVPGFSLEWLEILLTNLLYPKALQSSEMDSDLETIREELRRIRALERRKVVLRNPSFIVKTLKHSISKINSILDITKVEHETYGASLRMVILSDYIRKECMPPSQNDFPQFDKIGVVPVFESIRRMELDNAKLGILTGSFVVIPKNSEGIFREVAAETGISGNDMDLVPLDHDNRYCSVNVLMDDKHKLVRAMTSLFSKGGVTILVGTKSLLGEGWDAPSINSLVIASVVGSYMLSNQMRGRAIRSQRGNPDKTANIWHLVCIEPNEMAPGADYETMTRRFRAFTGVSFKEPIIENGFARLSVGQTPFSHADLKIVNDRMFMRAMNRGAIRQAWTTALKEEGQNVRLIEDVQFSREQLPQKFVFAVSVSYLFKEFKIAGLIFLLGLPIIAALTLNRAPFSFILRVLYSISMVLLVAIILFALPAISSSLGHSSPKRCLYQVGSALLVSLCHVGEITTNPAILSIHVEESDDGFVFSHISGCNRREKSIYLQSLQEILNPVEDPRYLLVKRTILGGVIDRKDYFAVPKVLGQRRSEALYFAKVWRHHVGGMDLVYTRTRSGRIELLKARIKSYSYAISQLITRWR
ncbi:MAG: DEAD/DEAH box helicase family protein [Candidatus Thorarchaeota archaeon]